MSAPRVSTGSITVQDVKVDGRAHAKLELADPGLLVALSAALHTTADVMVPSAFRMLGASADPVLVESTASLLLARPEVRAALTLVLTPEAARDLMDDLDEILHVVYYAADEDAL